MFELRLSIHAPASMSALAVVDAGLDEHNVAESALADVRPLHVIAERVDGAVAGGAIGRTWGECCELQQLWVEPGARSRGIGTRLIQSFEDAARARGCVLVYLETFSFQAPEFYQAHGYSQVLKVGGFTRGVVKFTLHKTIGTGFGDELNSAFARSPRRTVPT